MISVLRGFGVVAFTLAGALCLLIAAFWFAWISNELLQVSTWVLVVLGAAFLLLGVAFVGVAVALFMAQLRQSHH